MNKLIQYNKFAEDYHRKRRYPWGDFVQFQQGLATGGIMFHGTIIDLGCANGRHFELLKNINNRVIGIDNSMAFLKIAKSKLVDNSKITGSLEKKRIPLLQADMCFLPFRSNVVDGIISVAALHHIRTEKLRKKSFTEIAYILKNKGLLLFTVWRRWQKRFSYFFLKDWIKRRLYPSYRKKQKERGLEEFGDVFVPWTFSAENITVQRFYHLYSSKELKRLLKKFSIEKFKIMGGPRGKDNFFILCYNNALEE